MSGINFSGGNRPPSDPRLGLEPDAFGPTDDTLLPRVARASTIGDQLGFAAGMVGVAALGLITFSSLQAARHKPAKLPPAPVSAMPSIAPVVIPQDVFETDLSPAQLVSPPVPPASMPMVATAPVMDPMAMRSGALVFDATQPNDGKAYARIAGVGSNAMATGAAPPTDSSLTGEESFAARFSDSSSNKATRSIDLKATIPQGALIPAVLETGLNSDLPGFVRAMVTRDVYSFDGTVPLVPTGSRLIGQYKSGLSQGQTRTFVIWTRLIRPDGVSIELASPATDELGQAGVPGEVNNHFLRRFGSAILLSVVSGLTQTARDGDNVIVLGSVGEAQSVAREALAGDGKIPPTVITPQGASIQVFVARDLDFSTANHDNTGTP